MGVSEGIKSVSAVQNGEIPFYKYVYSASEDTFNEWSNSFRRLVRGHSKLELIVAIALSAPLYYRIQHIEGWEEHLLPLCTKWNLVGKYREGADCATRLALSIFGNPDELMEGIGSSGKVSKGGYLRGFHKAHSTDLYECDSLKVATDENSVYLFSSQKGIAAKLNGYYLDEGKLVIFDITGSFCPPDEIDSIEGNFSEVYGTAIKAFISEIADTKVPDEELLSDFKQIRETVKATLDKRFGHYKAIEGLTNSFTLVYMAAQYANRMSRPTNKDSSKLPAGYIGLSDLLAGFVYVAKNSLPKEVNRKKLIADVINMLKKRKESYQRETIGIICLPTDNQEKIAIFTYSRSFKSILNTVGKRVGKTPLEIIRILAVEGYLKTSNEVARNRYQDRYKRKRGYTMLIPKKEWNSK